jgi:hypothetical protein
MIFIAQSKLAAHATGRMPHPHMHDTSCFKTSMFLGKELPILRFPVKIRQLDSQKLGSLWATETVGDIQPGPQIS